MEFPYLQNEDVIKVLEWITEFHTIAYKTDLRYDIEKIKDFGTEQRSEQNFFFLSRKTGCNLYPERAVYLKDTAEYNAFQTWCTRQDTPLLYLVELKHRENDCVKGNITQMYYPQVANYVKENAQVPTHVLVDGKDFQTPKSFSYQSYQQNEREIEETFGPLNSVDVRVDNDPLLQALLYQNRANTMGQAQSMDATNYFFALEDHCRELYKDVEDYKPFANYKSFDPEENEADEEDMDR